MPQQTQAEFKGVYYGIPNLPADPDKYKPREMRIEPVSPQDLATDSEPEPESAAYIISSDPPGERKAAIGVVQDESPDAARQDDNGNNGNGNGRGSDERRGDRFDNGDWWDKSDEDRGDGKGPSQSEHRGSGGGYPKHGGGYYALSSKHKAAVKASSLEEGLSSLKL